MGYYRSMNMVLTTHHSVSGMPSTWFPAAEDAKPCFSGRAIDRGLQRCDRQIFKTNHHRRSDVQL